MQRKVNRTDDLAEDILVWLFLEFFNLVIKAIKLVFVGFFIAIGFILAFTAIYYFYSFFGLLEK